MNGKALDVARVSTGNFLEMYDFMVFGYYASAIGRTFFPTGREFLSLMLSLATFCAGFLMRPLGAIMLGAHIDHHGRRKGLLLTLGLMAVAPSRLRWCHRTPLLASRPRCWWLRDGRSRASRRV